MDRSAAEGTVGPARGHELPDDVSVRRWFAFYALFLLATVVPLFVMASGHEWVVKPPAGGEPSLGQRWDALLLAFAEAPAGVKLLGFAVYISLCCTFLPLPANAVVAAMAMKDVAVGSTMWSTTLLVALIGGAASTIANLNDYHLFTWMLRHHRIAGVRHTRLYRRAARWFSRGPFTILVIFNILPIPVDVVRMLATTYRYPRLPFAAANFIGRFIRYAALASATYLLGSRYGWISPAILLVLAAFLGMCNMAARAKKRQNDTRDRPPASA